jgi:hypothetical protein
LKNEITLGIWEFKKCDDITEILKEKLQMLPARVRTEEKAS